MQTSHTTKNDSESIRFIQRGRSLEVFTIAWNVIEGIVAIGAGLVASSVALVSFGVDSFVETTSAVVLLWRLQAELTQRESAAAEAVERRASRIAGALLLVLAAYIVVDALFVVPLLVREGLEGLHGEECDDCAAQDK